MSEHGRKGSQSEKVRNFAKVLKRLKEKDMTQSQLARKLGHAPKRITHWVQGIGEPSGSELAQIAEILDLPLGYLTDPAQTDPTPVVSRDELEVLELVRALNLPKREALRRLSTLPPGPSQAEPAGARRPAPKPSLKGRAKR